MQCFERMILFVEESLRNAVGGAGPNRVSYDSRGQVVGKANSPGARFDPQRKEKMLARREAENVTLAL